jgi:hypothetical protein
VSRLHPAAASFAATRRATWPDAVAPHAPESALRLARRSAKPAPPGTTVERMSRREPSAALRVRACRKRV